MRPSWDRDTQPLPYVIRSHRRPPDPWRIRWRKVAAAGAGGAIAAGVAVLVLALLPSQSTAATYVSPADMRAVCSRAAGWPGQTETQWLEQCVKAFTKPSPPPSSSPSPTAAPSPTVTGSPSPSPSPSTPSPSSSPTPVPSPTSPAPSPTPTGTPGPLLDCLRQELRCGWPTEHTTGPDPLLAVPMTTYPGPYPFRMQAGQTYENLVINGCVLVEGSNSVLRNSIVRPTAATLCAGAMAIDLERDTPLAGVRIERVKLDLANTGANRFNLRAVSGDGFTLDRVHCWGGGDCVHYGGDVVIRDSLFDVPECTAVGCDQFHIDALHSASGHPDPAKRHVLIQHNTIIMHGTGAGHPNAAIINGPDIGPYAYPQGTVIIRDNLMAGGGAVVYCAAHPEDTPTHTAEIWNNRISDLVWPRGGKWGPFYNDCMTPPAPGRLSNVWDRTGAVIPLGSWS